MRVTHEFWRSICESSLTNEGCKLDLSNREMTDNDIRDLVEAMRSLGIFNIRYLDLSNNALTDTSVGVLVDFFESSCLRVLSSEGHFGLFAGKLLLQANRITESGFERLGAFSARHPFAMITKDTFRLSAETQGPIDELAKHCFELGDRFVSHLHPEVGG